MVDPIKVRESEGLLTRKTISPKSSTAGRIAENIGTGEHAKNSIVWMTITWSFVIASGLSVLYFIVALFYAEVDFLNKLKDVWAIFIPVITLALGYAFGKNK